MNLRESHFVHELELLLRSTAPFIALVKKVKCQIRAYYSF